jgi:HKD family nuclease
MKEAIITNSEEGNLKDRISILGEKADEIKIATAFFSDTKFISDWLSNSKKVDLIISLRPPTNYYSLKSIHAKKGITIQFLGSRFHSKFYIFLNKKKPFACVVGSSNFTNGGLFKNIETNIILSEEKYLTEFIKQFSSIWEQSFSLQPADLNKYKKVFDNFQNREKNTEDEQSKFEKKILSKRTVKKKKPKIGKEGKQYFKFWRIIDDVKDLVQDISSDEYPNIPVYISIDHFWHWIKVVWSKQDRPKPNSSNKNIIIPKLFNEYCDWDKATGNFTEQMARNSKSIFGKYLSEEHIDKLTTDEAKLIYSNLHSGAMRTRRFGADEDFVNQNTIEEIRESLKYLLYSNDELDLRIHNLCTNTKYKLNQFGSSGVQELIGWVNPKNYPMRNDKADFAIEALGYELK